MTLKVNGISADNFFKIETYTDPAAGSIAHYIPVTTIDGTRDMLREDKFVGSCVLNTPRGPMNISFPINALNLFKAVQEFPNAVRDAVKEMQSQQLRNNIATGGGLIDLSKSKQ